MKVIIRAQSTQSTKAKVGRLKVSVNGNYHIIKAVVFSHSQSSKLLAAADNASIEKKDL